MDLSCGVILPSEFQFHNYLQQASSILKYMKWN